LWRSRFAELLSAADCETAAVEFVQAVPGQACPGCRGRGYHGRTSIIEVFPLAGAEALIAERAPLDIFLRRAREQGCRTLFEDGVRKAALGLTTLEEVHAAVETPSP
jgi:type II secretory ATPase GspE/PulE/Tfp pilus assembly ATPase PilB-like protein